MSRWADRKAIEACAKRCGYWVAAGICSKSAVSDWTWRVTSSWADLIWVSAAASAVR